MPGVVVTTAVRTGPSNANIAPSSTFFVVGTANRGPIDEAVLVTSLNEFETYFGPYEASKSLHTHLQTFFEEGGSRAYVARVVGSGATAGTINLNNAGAVASLRLDAANPGAWSADVKAQVVTAGSGFAVVLLYRNVEVYRTAEMATAGAAATAINASAVASLYVTATALVAGNTLAVAAATALSAGNEGSAPSTANHVTGLTLFEGHLGSGAVAIPGQNTSTIWDGLLAHAAANNRIALMAGASNASDTDMITNAAGYGSNANAQFGAMYWPWVNVTITGGATATISPESYVAAKRAVAHNTVGPWQAPAGLISRADFVTGLATQVTKTVGDSLDAARVNALRVIQGGVRIYGARSLSSDTTNWRYITYRDLVNYVVTQVAERMEDLVFSPIDGRKAVFGRLEARAIGVLEPLRKSGALYEAFDTNGNQLDPGYSVEVSDALNPPSQLADGLVKAKVGIRPSSVSDRIEVEIVKSNLTSSVV